MNQLIINYQGTFFTYEISAIMVKFVEQRRSLTYFLTTLCAIIVRNVY